MAITVNEFVEELEKVWFDLNWNRKFKNSYPEENIIHIFHAYSLPEVTEAKKVLSKLVEEDWDSEGKYILRTAHLANYSSGEAIVITEYEEEE